MLEEAVSKECNLKNNINYKNNVCPKDEQTNVHVKNICLKVECQSERRARVKEVGQLTKLGHLTTTADGMGGIRKVADR